MYKSDFVLLFVMIPLSVSQIINIQFNEGNEPYIPNVFVGELTSFDIEAHYIDTVDARLHLDHRSLLAVGWNGYWTAREYDDDSVTSIIPLRNYFELGSQNRGHLIDTHGPVTILRNTSSSNRDGILILNNTFGLEQFNQSCSPGSLARIPFVLDDRWPTDVTLNATWPASGRQITGITSDHPTYINFMWNQNPEFYRGIFDLPRPIANEIHEIIANSGAVFDQRNISIYNCTIESFISDLPVVEISFPRLHSTIRVFPEDYILSNSARKRCMLNFRPEYGSTRFWFFHPLALPNVNVHIVGNDLFICDAL